MEKHPQAELIKLVVDGLPPQKKIYPVTKLKGTKLHKIYMNADSGADGYQDFVALANAVLRHAVDNGYLFTQEYVTKAVAVKEF